MRLIEVVSEPELPKHCPLTWTLNPMTKLIDVDDAVSWQTSSVMVKETMAKVGFGNVVRFNMGGTDLTSLKGCPRHVSEDFNCNNNSHLSSFDFAPVTVGGNFNAQGVAATAKASSIKTKIGGFLRCDVYLEDVIKLFAVNAKTLKISNLYLGGALQGSDVRDTVEAIITNHWASKDSLACQDELIDAGII